MWVYYILAVIFFLERVSRFNLHSVPIVRPGLPLDALYLAQWVLSLFIPGLLVASIVEAGWWVVLPRREMQPVWCFLFTLLTIDFFFYWSHRFFHRTKLGWSLHQAHHAPAHLDSISSFRRHFGEEIFYVLFFVVMVYFFLILWRLPLLPFVLAWNFKMMWTGFMHANLSFSARFLPFAWLGWLIFLPVGHRLHHVNKYKNRNYGSVLTVWDRLFGTYVEDEKASALAVGYETASVYPQTFLGQLLYPLRLFARKR